MSPSYATSLESLPLLVLERICEFLVQDDYQRRSLWAFSLASKCCYSAATAERCSQIGITLHSWEKLLGDLGQWVETLSAHEQFRHVRRLRVRRPRPGGEQGGGGEGHDYEDLRPCFKVPTFCQPHATWYRVNRCRPAEPQEKTQQDGLQALARFICRLKGLEDFVWDTEFLVPQCILSAVHQIRCRLHVHNFSFDRLVQSRAHPINVDPDELALATSPHLHSVFMPFFDFETQRNAKEEKGTTLPLISGTPSGLMHAWVRLERSVTRPGGANYVPNEPLVAGFNLKGLRSLVIESVGSTAIQINGFLQHVDFANLQCLAIHSSDEIRVVGMWMDSLVKMAMNRQLRLLRMLTFRVAWLGEPHRQDALVRLFEHLNSLTSLDFTGFISETAFKTLMQNHGQSLRKIRLDPYRHVGSEGPLITFSGCVMQLMAEQCPNLEEIEVPTRRTLGDARETQIYRALSQFPRLKRVVLHLQCSKGAFDDDDLGEDGSLEYRRQVTSLTENVPASYLREVFKNGAIDSSLALSIFNLVSGGRNLRHLTLRIAHERSPRFYSHNLNDILVWIGRSWACERDNRGKVSIQELRKESRLIRAQRLQNMDGTAYLKVWNELWPRKSARWWEEWKSLPLSNSSA